MAQEVMTPVGLPAGISLPAFDFSTIKRLASHRLNLLGLGLLLPLVVLALAFPLLPLQQPLEVNVAEALKGPSLSHPFGTDRLGRDLLSRNLDGARISLAVGFTVAIVSVIGGVLIGTVAGFFGHFVDTAVMAVVDVFLSFPGLLLAIAMVAVFGSGLLQVIVAISITDIPRAIRLQRSLVLGLKARSYIDAARMASAPARWIVLRHLIPNTLAPMLVVGSIYAANAILVEASLSFLGLGITPPTPSWGNIIHDGQAYLQRAWWISTFPGLAILLVAVSLHLMSDGVRESLDPSKRT